MVKKLFALASVTGLTGLVAAITAAGCSSTEVVPGGPADSGATTDAKKDTGKPVTPPEDAEPPAPSCKATGGFTAPAINPPTAPQKTPCSQAQMDSIATECIDSTAAGEAKCTAARALPANKTCTDCVFGTKADAQWKVILLDGNKITNFNQAGCIDHVTGVTKCGSAYITLLRCINTLCPMGDGKCDETSGDACFDEVKDAECKEFFFNDTAPVTGTKESDEACANGVGPKTTAGTTCFQTTDDAAGAKLFFVNMMKTSCASDPPDGG